jgi:hypothetical protein
LNATSKNSHNYRALVRQARQLKQRGSRYAAKLSLLLTEDSQTLQRGKEILLVLPKVSVLSPE